jgi:hypothetical protein
MNKGGNETPSKPKAALRKPSKASPRLKTVVALGRLHPDPEPSAPPLPALTSVPTGENLTSLYASMCGTEAPPQACALAGVATGSTWGQCIVASHVRAAVGGDNASVNTIVTRLDGKAATAAMSEEQFLAYLESVPSRPDAARIRQLVMKRLGVAPNLYVNFVDPQAEPSTAPPQDKPEVTA